MKRDVIIVLGKTGYGKSLWSRIFASKAKRFLVYDPTGDNIADYDADFDDTMENPETEFRIGRLSPEYVPDLGHASFVFGDNLFLAEEASTLFEKGIRNLPDYWRSLVFLGRHRRCSLLLVAQRATSIPIDIRSQANRIVTFGQHEDDDLRWLAEFFPKEYIRQIPYLPKLRCFDFCDGRVYSYSILHRAEKFLGRKLDIGESLGYSHYWK